MMTLRQARLAVAPSLGLPANFDGTAGAISTLSELQKERLNVETVRYVIAHPGDFPPAVVQLAHTLAGKQNFGVVGNYRAPTLLDDAAAFAEAYGEVAGETLTGAARVAGESAKALGINLGAVLGISAAVAILYFGAPVVLPQLRAAFKTK